MSVDEQFEVFRHLDKGNKGFLNYHDFCNLSDERRRGIDPAQAMMRQYEQVGREGQALINAGNKARSPSQKEKFRLKESSAKKDKESEMAGQSVVSSASVKQYLNSFELDDLRHIISDRKSSKKLAHGPIIGGKRTGWGE